MYSLHCKHCNESLRFVVGDARDRHAAWCAMGYPVVIGDDGFAWCGTAPQVPRTVYVDRFTGVLHTRIPAAPGQLLCRVGGQRISEAVARARCRNGVGDYIVRLGSHAIDGAYVAALDTSADIGAYAARGTRGTRATARVHRDGTVRALVDMCAHDVIIVDESAFVATKPARETAVVAVQLADGACAAAVHGRVPMDATVAHVLELVGERNAQAHRVTVLFEGGACAGISNVSDEVRILARTVYRGTCAQYLLIRTSIPIAYEDEAAAATLVAIKQRWRSVIT